MTLRVTILCAGPAEGIHGPALGDGPLDRRALREAATAKAALPPYSLALRAPSVRCAQTAGALGVAAVPEAALRDIDHGRWSGFTRADIAAADPHGFSAWLTDPDAAPHGGETVGRLCLRTASWLGSLPGDAGHVLAITEASVVRAVLVHVRSAPARTFWHLDVPPLSAVTLTMRDGLWHARPVEAPVPRQRASADDGASVGSTARDTRR
ncbi:histidine phosphatase family protein [Streptomyces wuyuanensis]|uniref:histidine phosphatase family protein n=1 Tax=Streptomyces wuyuanensis TaxID=1196353 RepID=UPI0037A21AA4